MTGYVRSGYATCPTTGKRCYHTRAEAKRNRKRIPDGSKLSAYRCGNHWHLGRLPGSVREGDYARDLLQDPPAPGSQPHRATRRQTP